LLLGDRVGVFAAVVAAAFAAVSIELVVFCAP